jgi:integrase
MLKYLSLNTCKPITDIILAKERGGGREKRNQKGNQRLNLVLQGNAYDNFMNGMHTEATRRLYNFGLRNFMEFKGAEHVNDLLPDNNVTGAPLVTSDVMAWINHMKKEGLSSCAINSYVPGVLLFYDMNNVILNKRMISKCLPPNRKLNRDRPYTREEIDLLLTFCGPRERALVLLLASTGMRIGAVTELRLHHLHKIEQYGLYKIIVYEGDKHEYYCFTTTEAAQAIDSYLEYRKRHGEKISSEETPEAPLIREEFDINDQLMARYPKVMRPEALGVIINLKLQRSGIVPPLTPLKEGQKRGSKRNAIPRSHGFRKFVITAMARCKVDQTIRKKLTDHSIKLDKDYVYKTEEEMLQEYLKVVDDLTINEENRLKRRVELLEVKKSDYEQMKEEWKQFKQEQTKRENLFASALNANEEEMKLMTDIFNQAVDRLRKKLEQ